MGSIEQASDLLYKESTPDSYYLSKTISDIALSGPNNNSAHSAEESYDEALIVLNRDITSTKGGIGMFSSSIFVDTSGYDALPMISSYKDIKGIKTENILSVIRNAAGTKNEIKRVVSGYNKVTYPHSHVSSVVKIGSLA